MQVSLHFKIWPRKVNSVVKMARSTLSNIKLTAQLNFHYPDPSFRIWQSSDLFRYLELENRSLYDSLNERRNANVPKRTVLPCTKGIIFSGGSGRGLGRGLGGEGCTPRNSLLFNKKAPLLM